MCQQWGQELSTGGTVTAGWRERLLRSRGGHGDDKVENMT